MKTKILLSIGLLLITCNSYAQAPAKTLLTSEEVCALIDQDPTWNKIIQFVKAGRGITYNYKKHFKDPLAWYDDDGFKESFGSRMGEFFRIDKEIESGQDEMSHQAQSQLLVTCGEELYKKGKLFGEYILLDDGSRIEALRMNIKRLEACVKKDEFRCNYRVLSSFAYPLAFHLPNGAEKLAELAEKDKLFSRFEETLKKGEKNYKKFAGIKEGDDEKEKIEIAQKSQRISKIKNGNLAAAKTCSEVAEALIPKGEVVSGFGYLISTDSKAVYRTPTKKMYASAGKLISYNGKQATTFDISPLTGEKHAFILKFSDKTLWFNDRLAIGTVLYFVGRYVDNDTVSIKQGTNEFDVTARVYEVLSASSM